MINVFTDSLFKMELGRLASEKLVNARQEQYMKFQQVMHHLKTVKEAPKEVRSMTGSYITIPELPRKSNIEDEIHQHLARLSRILTTPNLPDHHYRQAKELRKGFKELLNKLPSVKIVGTACASKCVHDIHSAALNEIGRLKETVRQEPENIAPWDPERGIWYRWNRQEQRWKQIRTQRGRYYVDGGVLEWDGQQWKRVKGVAQGRVA